jgi:hypothetical protein
MKQLSKPEVKKYYLITDEEGNIIQEGSVNPDQVLSLSDAYTITYSNKRLDIISEIEDIIGPQSAFNDLITPEGDGFTWGDGPADSSFFVFATPSVSEPLSRALYKVVNPEGEGLYARVHQAPEGHVYDVLQFTLHDVVPIALGADPRPLAEALAITVEHGALKQEEVDKIVDAISTYAGQEVKLTDFIPDSWKQRQISKEEAIELGYQI